MKPGILLVAAALTALAGPATASTAVYLYSQSAGAPWGVSSNEDAMDAVFGAGQWTPAGYNPAGAAAILGSTFAWLEGSDYSANALAAFLTTHRTELENWVQAGGRLLVNAAPNEGGNITALFDVTLNFDYWGDSSMFERAVAADPNHPIFLGPYLPAATSYTGTYLGHAYVTGAGLTPILTGEGTDTRMLLAERRAGSGLVLFGGMAVDPFYQQPDGHNLRKNILSYANYMETPEPSSAFFFALGLASILWLRRLLYP
jgi:hypothetical protein